MPFLHPLSLSMFRLTSLSLLLLLVFSQTVAFAQSEDEEELGPRLPFAAMAFRNVDQSLTNVAAMFDATGRSDMTDMIETFLTDKAGNLDGIDRTRPFGFLFFLNDQLPPQPARVTFVPVSDIDAFIRTASLGPAKPEKVEGKENVYRFPFGRRNRGINMVIENGYAFAASDESMLEDLPDPETIVRGMVSRYDVSVAALIRNIPPLMKDFFIASLQGSAQAELQQRDDESDAAHKMRKAGGQSTLELMTQVLRDGEQITLGLEAIPDEKMAALELLIDATPESEFSEFVKNIGGRKSIFEPLHSDTNPLTMSISWKMDRREKEMMTGMIDGLELALKEQLPEQIATPTGRMADSLRATVEQEHFNAVFQFVPIEKTEFALLGGMKLVGSETFGTALREIMGALNEVEGIDSVELDVHQHQNVNFHRLIAEDARDEDLRIYGGHPSVYLGSGNGIFWFGVGGDRITNELDFAIDLMLETPPGSLTGSSAPFQAVFRLLPWMSLPPPENDDVNGRELTMEAMEPGNDAVRIEVRPTETGGRVRMQFEEGFVRLLGLVLAQLYDRTQL